MAVNPSSPFYGTNRIDHYRAVYDLDIKAANPNDPTSFSAKAQAVVIAGTLNGSGAIVPLTGGGGGGGSSLADSLVVDAAGIYWILQDQGGGTFVYYKLSTLAVGTPTAPVVPAAGSNGIQIVDQKYTATVAGTGYAINDILEHVLVLNITTNPPTVSQSSWINVTQATVLAGAPTATNINPIDDNVNASIADGADVTQGAKADAAYGGAGSASAISILKGCYSLLAAPLPTGTNALGTVGISGTVAATQSGAWSTGRTWTLANGTDSVAAVQSGAWSTGRTWTLESGTDSIAIGGTLPAFTATPTFNLGTAAQLPTTINGTNLSAASLSVVLPADQQAISVNSDPAQIIALPTANSIAALNGTVVWQVEGGAAYLLALTNPAAATTAWVGTVTFQYSVNGGTTWSNLNATPLTAAVGANVTTATANGLWQVIPPSGANGQVQIRANMTAYTSGTVYADLASLGVLGGAILLPWSYTVTSGQTLVGPINASGFSEIGIQISAITSTVLTVQGTNDPSLTTWDTISNITPSVSSTGSNAIISVGTYRAGTSGFKFIRIQCIGTGTVLTVQGVYGRLGGSQIYSASVNVQSIGGAVAQAAISNGSVRNALGITLGTAVSNVDQNATAFAGSGSVLGTVVASTQGGGAAVSAEINVSALTLGTATAVFAILQESRGGTNFSDIWVSDPITATTIVSMPAIPVAGRRRWRFFSVGGTSTTVTVTITTLELPTGFPVMRQGRDAYAATNPLASMFNSVALTASTIGTGATCMTTIGNATTPMNIEGSNSVVAFVTLGNAPTVTTQPVLTLQLSMDGTNWWSTASTITAAGNGTYMVNNSAVGGTKFARLAVTTAAIYGLGNYTITNMGVNGVN